MTRTAALHPNANVLAMFVEGTLEGNELQIVIDHLGECQACRSAVGTAAEFRKQEPGTSAVTSHRLWLPLAAAAVLGFAGLATVLLRQALDPMRAMQPSGKRSYEARLAGFDYAPFAVSRSSSKVPARVQAAAAELQERAQRAPTARNLHRAGVAELVIGDAIQSVDALNHASALAPDDPAILSDLAAAHLQLAATGKESSYLEALKYANAAVMRDRTFLPALFNKALALEEIGPVGVARAAWLQYLNLDSNSPWSVDARAHLGRLNTHGATFENDLNELYQRVRLDGGVSYAADLVSRYPQQSRAWCEAEIMARWAAALLSGDDGDAACHLTVARNLASALATRFNERLAVDAVAAAEAHARSSAEAHLLYREARIEYSRHKPAEAEPKLAHAADMFHAIDSPMALEARYYQANAIFDQNRTIEAKKLLDEVETELTPSYRALRGHVLWEMGLCLNATGRTRAALAAFNESSVAFASVGDRENEAATRSLSADVHAFIGDFEHSTIERVRSLRALRNSTAARLASPLIGASSAAMAQFDWALAELFLSIQSELAEQTGDRQMLSDALLHRSILSFRKGAQEKAEAELNEAQRAVGDLSGAIRARGEADLAFAQAIVLRRNDPVEAARLLSSAIEFHGRSGRAAYLPDLYLARARAHKRRGEFTAAEADLRSGIQQLEALRDLAPAGVERWGIFDTAPELFEDAIELCLRDGRVEEAWQLADRSRGRGLLDRVTSSQKVLDHRAIPPDTLLIEFAVLGGRVVSFLISRDDVTLVRGGPTESDLKHDESALREAIVANRRVDASMFESRLYQSFVDPIPSRLQRSRLVIVPYGALHLMPFSALKNAVTGRYLIEEHEIVISPSAAAYLALLHRATSRCGTLSALMISGGSGRGAVHLPAAEDEIRGASVLYGRSIVLEGSALTPERVLAAARDVDVIHFAGHGTQGMDGGEIVLSGSQSLNEEQIAAEHLVRAPIVVLAACDTAVGSMETSEGPISIARGFLAAGARSVIATLFPVDDLEASQFFKRLHQRLSRGETAARAVRETQIEFIGRNEAVWSAVQTVGS